MTSWLDQLMQCTEELESPRSFFYWSGLAIISAVLKDNVWIPRAGGMLDLYPNIYVMLLAGSALKKGPPIGLAKQIIRKVNNTKLIVGRSSIQGILKELGIAQTMPGGRVSGKSCGIVIASEFSSSLVEDPAAFNCLTDLYDRNYNVGEWRQLLKSDTFQLKDPTLSMLVATNDPHLKDFVKEKDMFGGFFGRMFIIREDRVSCLNSLVNELKHPPNIDELSIHLSKIAQLKGAFQPLANTEAGEIYDEWYNSFYKLVQDQRIEDPTGTIGRFGDSVLKVAVLISMSQQAELVITSSAVVEAIEVCEKLITSLRRAMLGNKGMAQYAEQKALIIQELLNRPNHSISRTVLLKKFWMHFNSDELDIIIRSFDDAGMIKPHNHGGTLVYEMPEKVVKGLLNHLEGKE